MVLGFHLAVWFGILTFISMFITAYFGFAMRKGKPVFKYHNFFAILTLILAIIHVILVVLWLYFGMTF